VTRMSGTGTSSGFVVGGVGAWEVGGGAWEVGAADVTAAICGRYACPLFRADFPNLKVEL